MLKLYDNHVLFINTSEKADVSRKISNDYSRSLANSLQLTNEVRYGDAIQSKDIDDIRYIEATVWALGDINNANIAAKFGNRRVYKSNTVEEQDSLGWKKIELSFWIPNKGDNKDFLMHLWNSGKDVIYFDDFQIIKKKTQPKTQH